MQYMQLLLSKTVYCLLGNYAVRGGGFLVYSVSPGAFGAVYFHSLEEKWIKNAKNAQTTAQLHSSHTLVK